MPTVLRILECIWIIHTRDHGFPHVTIYKGTPDNFEACAKIRLDKIIMIENNGFSEKSINTLLKATELYQQILIEKWREYHEK
ncbi:MAG: DUF4160 domain-containing protein [Bdellovibrionota bacterium]